MYVSFFKADVQKNIGFTYYRGCYEMLSMLSLFFINLNWGSRHRLLTSPWSAFTANKQGLLINRWENNSTDKLNVVLSELIYLQPRGTASHPASDPATQLASQQPSQTATQLQPHTRKCTHLPDTLHPIAFARKIKCVSWHQHQQCVKVHRVLQHVTWGSSHCGGV